MIYRYLQLFLLFLLGFSVNTISSQELQYRSDLITRENGLSNGIVSCTIKDRFGFVWFGTRNGLNRYDGYEITVFQSETKDSTSLSNSNINAFYEDKEGYLWIGTDNGLNRYDQKTGKFKRFFLRTKNSADQRNNQINGISQDAKGTFWIACQEEGLISLDKSTGVYQQYGNSFSERSNNVIAVLPDNQNDHYLWLGTADGLFLFNTETKSFHQITKGTEGTSLFIQAIKQDQSGNLYLGTWGNGLIKLDRKTNLLSFCSGKGENSSYIRNSIIRYLSFDISGSLILDVWGKGLMKYNLTTCEFDEWVAENVSDDLKSKMITSIYADPSGIMWIGTLHEGVIKIATLINSFTHYGATRDNQAFRSGGGVVAILEDSKGYLWFGTRFWGLYKFDRKTQEYTAYKQQQGSSTSISSNSILSLLEVKEGNNQVIWIGTDGGGLNRLETATGKCYAYRSQTNKSHGPSSNSVSSIIQYDADHLLIGTRDRDLGEGLDVFNLRTGKFVNLRYNPDDSTSLGSNNVIKIFKDKLGTVWVGTRNGGLNEFVIKNINADSPEQIGYFTRYTNDPAKPGTLSDNTVNAIFDDADNNLWVGTNMGGLSKFDRKQKVFTSENMNKYLKDNIIYGILGDNNNNLWISTSRGIIALDLTSNMVHRFDKYNGLKEKAFIQGAYFKSASGEMFFGGVDGCNSFHPDSIRVNLKVPKIAITSLSFSGKRGTHNVTELTGKSVIASKIVKVPYYQNNFSVTFSSLDFQMPAKNRYRYILDGYDNDWVETDATRRYVNYTNLPPGKYIFKVIGSNSDDIWNHEGTSVTLYISPPFWKTTAFMVMSVLLVIGVISFIFYSILKKYRKEKLQVELEAQLSLQDERKQLRTLVDCMPDLIFIKDKESKFIVANKKVAQIMGTTPENLIGKTDFEFYSPDLAQAFYNDEQYIIRTGKPKINYEETAFDENGNRIIISTTKMPLKNKNGDTIGVVGICRDITQLKRIEKELIKKSDDLQETNQLLEGRQKEILLQSEELATQTQNLLAINAELERLNRTKDKLFSIIAHDLKNPFNAIIGFSRLMKEDFNDMDNEQKMNVLDLINISSQTAYNLLENLLQWARTQTNKVKFSPENFDLAEIATAVIDLHCATADRKGVKLSNKIKPDTFVHADRNMIDTVLRNLISNAIKFSHPDGNIVIAVNKSSDGIEVEVTDDGIGMSKESLGKLFRIDTYYSTSGTSGESGTGLGLIICKEFVERNNGRIKAISKEGTGTRLSFTLNPAKFN